MRLLRLRRVRTARHGARVGREGEAVDAEFIGAQFAERLPASCAIVGGVARGVIGSDTASGECREFGASPRSSRASSTSPATAFACAVARAHDPEDSEHSHETGSNNPIDDPRYIKSADDWMAHRAPEFPEYDSDGEPIERDPDQLVAQSSLILNAEPFSSLDEDGNAFDELANMPREKCGDASGARWAVCSGSKTHRPAREDLAAARRRFRVRDGVGGRPARRSFARA